MKIFWYCEQCQQTGIVFYSSCSGITEIMEAMQGAHWRGRPDCVNTAAGLRTLNFDAMLKPHVPAWAVEPLKQLIEMER